MQIIRLITIVFFALMCCSSQAQEKESLPFGYTSVSPDNRFAAHLIEVPLATETTQYPLKKKPCLSINDQQKNHAYSLDVTWPVYLIKWTLDANTLISIGHIAGGTQLTSWHYTDGRWQSYEIVPLNENQTGHYSVVGILMELSAFKVTYKVSDNSAGYSAVEHYTVTIHVDGASGAIINTEPKHYISDKAYARASLHVR